MQRYATDRPGLVTFYEIHLGNGAGLILQPWNPHAAIQLHNLTELCIQCWTSCHRYCNKPLPISTLLTIRKYKTHLPVYGGTHNIFGSYRIDPGFFTHRQTWKHAVITCCK